MVSMDAYWTIFDYTLSEFRDDYTKEHISSISFVLAYL